ncbi:MAG: efflux RND transporter periplasmic adaptor subunit [Bacteroidota bacterium]|nr:efflux RND transporter periplasmic adaptor subunit [Bacteroidota bacterium]
MKKKIMSISTLIIAAALVLGIFWTGCGKSSNGSAADDSTAVAAKKERKVLYWYDPMSPTIHFDHPGKSPTMDMDLVPKYADEEESNPNIVKVDPAMVQNIGIVTGSVEKRKLTRTINTYGVVSPDEKEISDINTRVSGWIEKLFFDYTGMDVKRGEAMAVIYSPDLIAAEQEFLQSVSFAKASQGTVTSSDLLLKSSRDRLKFFGMSDKGIDALQSSGTVIDRVTIHSPADGTVLEKNIFEGQRISAGQTLFRVADLRRVWILADVFKIDIPFLNIGSPVTVTFNGQEFKGRVDFIYPEIDVTARSVKARIDINNPGLALRVGQYVNVSIHSLVSYDAVAVPAQAVINTGLRQVVAVVLGEGRFELQNVKLGAYADGYYEILDGLQEGQSIVTSGQFLIDSDANLKNAGAALMAGMPGMGGGAEQGNGKTGSTMNKERQKEN